MANRGSGGFQKRQKEIARKDKQKRKAERRAERKLSQTDDSTSGSNLDTAASADSEAQPEEHEPTPLSGAQVD